MVVDDLDAHIVAEIYGDPFATTYDDVYPPRGEFLREWEQDFETELTALSFLDVAVPMGNLACRDSCRKDNPARRFHEALGRKTSECHLTLEVQVFHLSQLSLRSNLWVLVPNQMACEGTVHRTLDDLRSCRSRFLVLHQVQAFCHIHPHDVVME